MDEIQYKGPTSQPIIAQRELVRPGSPTPVVIRVYHPEPIPTYPGMPWRCGYAITGLAELEAVPDIEGVTLAPGEVFFAGGLDSFHSLVAALAHIRGLLDLAEDQLGWELTWPLAADWGHLVPRAVTQWYGRRWERRLLETMEREEERMVAERVPNPYAWDDPRHPSQQLRRQSEQRRGGDSSST